MDNLRTINICFQNKPGKNFTECLEDALYFFLINFKDNVENCVVTLIYEDKYIVINKNSIFDSLKKIILINKDKKNVY